MGFWGEKNCKKTLGPQAPMNPMRGFKPPIFMGTKTSKNAGQVVGSPRYKTLQHWCRYKNQFLQMKLKIPFLPWRFVLANLQDGLFSLENEGLEKSAKSPNWKKTNHLNQSSMTLGSMLTFHHGNPQPSFLGVITHILGCKTFIFHGFGFPWQGVISFDPKSFAKRPDFSHANRCGWIISTWQSVSPRW